jgi:arylsulfatase A-like enzyme/Tfp pilus assembly protein PilF
MKITKKQKNYLKKNFRTKSDKELADALQLPEDNIRILLNKLNLKRTKKELKKLSKKTTKNHIHKNKKKIFNFALILSFAIIVSFIIIWWLFRDPNFTNKTPENEIEVWKSRTFSDKEKKYNVFLITIDTLRADHLGCYGYEKIKTPNLDHLAQEGAKFENAIVQVPLTLPSHASILTGTYPFYHGIKDNAGYFLHDNMTTIAEVFQHYGYKTGAAVGAFVLDSKWGLDQGFEIYDDQLDPQDETKINLDIAERRGDCVLKAALKWLEQHKNEKLFFWLHLYDPHTPYTPPQPFDSLYAEQPYDGEIAFTDQLIGSFKSWLSDNHFLEKSLFVLIGDHGEGLGEHQESTHGYFVYDSTLRVPLIIRFPGKKFAGTEVTQIVRSIDIMPTILQWVNMPIPKEVQGVSLLPFIIKDKKTPALSSYSESYYAREHFGWSELQCIQTDRYKYIKAPESELYDLKQDPQELNNLYDDKREIAQKLDQQLKAIVNKYKGRHTQSAQKKLSAADLDKLKSLGYLGSVAGNATKGKTTFPDPKHKIYLYNKLLKVEATIQQGNFSQANYLLKEIISIDPQIIDAYFLLGRLAIEMREYQESIMWNKKLLSLNHDHVLASFNLALSYRQLGKLDDAVTDFQRVLQLDSRNQKALNNLVDIYLETDNLYKAQEYCRKALQLDDKQADIYVSLASVYYAQKQFSKAESALKKAINLSSNQPIPNLHFNLALLHENNGAIHEAIKEYEAELNSFPENYKALTNLGILYEEVNLIEKQIEVFRQLIRLRPKDFYGYFLLAQSLLIHQQKKDEAKELVKQSITLNPGFPPSHYLLSAIYQKEGNNKAAREEFDLAQKLEKTEAPN